MSIYHNRTHVLGAFYWEIIGNTVWKLLLLKRVFHSWDWTMVHQFSILNWEGKEYNLSQIEHFLHFIDISRLKCFSAVKENAHINLAITWFRLLN